MPSQAFDLAQFSQDHPDAHDFLLHHIKSATDELRARVYDEYLAKECDVETRESELKLAQARLQRDREALDIREAYLQKLEESCVAQWEESCVAQGDQSCVAQGDQRCVAQWDAMKEQRRLRRERESVRAWSRGILAWRQRVMDILRHEGITLATQTPSDTSPPSRAPDRAFRPESISPK